MSTEAVSDRHRQGGQIVRGYEEGESRDRGISDYGESCTTSRSPVMLISSDQVRHLEAIMRIAEAFCKMRLSDFCSSQDIDRAIAVTVDSFVGSQKLSCKKALARAFAKYVLQGP